MTIALIPAETLRARITKLSGACAEIEGEIHALLVQGLAHIAHNACGDWTILAGVMNALGKGQRREAAAVWAGKFSNGKLSVAVDSKTNTYRCKLKEGWTITDFDIEAANETTYADLTAEVRPQTMDVAKFIKTIERVANNDKLNDDGSPKVSPGARAFAANVVAFIRKAELAAATTIAA